MVADIYDGGDYKIRGVAQRNRARVYQKIKGDGGKNQHLMKYSERKEERMKKDTRLGMITSKDLAGFSQEGRRSRKAMGRRVRTNARGSAQRLPRSFEPLGDDSVGSVGTATAGRC